MPDNILVESFCFPRYRRWSEFNAPLSQWSLSFKLFSSVAMNLLCYLFFSSKTVCITIVCMAMESYYNLINFFIPNTTMSTTMPKKLH